MRKLFFSSAFILLCTWAAAQSNSTSADEQAIRNLVAQANEGKNVVQSTDDVIFVSGPYPRPFIGKTNEERQRIADSLSKVRSNFSYKREIVRLVVAKSGDIAYEFGNGVINFDNANKEHQTVNNSYVRTWRKVNGQWMVDIVFHRPNR